MKQLYTFTFLLISFCLTAQVNLLTDGDFEANNAANVWTVDPEIRLENNNYFFFADVITAGNPWDTQLSQLVSLTRGATYTLSFEASTSMGNTRTIIAGIAQSEAPYASATETVTLSSTNETFTYDFIASFAAPHRVLFDMGADTGIVVIDNVSLVVKDITGAENNVLLEDFSGSPNTEPFEGLTSATIEADPATGGTNGKALKLITNPSGNAWQGATILFAAGSYANISTNKTIAVDVYATSAISIMAKVEDEGKFSSPPAANTQTHTGSGWETLIFKFTTASDNTNVANGTYTKVAIYPNRKADDTGWNDPVVDQTIYIDNIKSTEAAPQHQNGLQDGDETGVDCGGASAPACPLAPTDAPPTPPSRNTSDVISIYGEAYNDAIGLSNVGWDSGSDSEVKTIANNEVLKITFNDFIGFDLGSIIDATDMTHVHMDIWIADVFVAGQVLKPTWSNHAGGNGQTDAFENLYAVGAEDSRKWISIDYEFANSTTTFGQGKDARAELAQFLIGSAATLDLIYVDNIYVYKGTPLSFGEIDGFNFVAYPNPVENTLNVSAGVSVDQVSIFDLTGREVMRAAPNATAFSLDVADLNKGLYLVSVKAGEQELTTKLVK